MARRGLRVKPATALVYLVLILGTVPMLFPFVWMVLTSLKPFQEVFSLNLLPSNPTLASYVQLFSRTLFPRWFLNSTIVAAITVGSVLFFDSLVGYTLAKLPFPGKNVVFVLILSTLFVPTEMLVLPWYQMSAQYGWLDTYWGIMFPGIMTAFGVFLMRQAFATLPDELLDAGRIDGLSEFGIFLRIALPLVKPSLAALAILTFIGNWNAAHREREPGDVHAARRALALFGRGRRPVEPDHRRFCRGRHSHDDRLHHLPAPHPRRRGAVGVEVADGAVQRVWWAPFGP